MTKLPLVRELLTDPARWIQGEYKNNGCFCLVGALRHVWNNRDTYAGYDGYQNDTYALARLTGLLDEDGSACAIISFNDRSITTHNDILNLLDRAIENAV